MRDFLPLRLGLPRFAQKKWGPASLPAPTAPSEGSAGVRNLTDKTFRPTCPLSILAHQLRRRFPSCSSLFRRADPFYLTARPEGSLVFRPVRPGTGTEVPAKTTRCSAALLGIISTASRFAHLPHEEVGSRVARQEDYLFRRLFPAGPEKNRNSSHCLPAEIGP